MRYLWIDSICIIQDSPEDWQKEAADMGRIFGDAMLTVFAVGAEDDDGGCFLSWSGAAIAMCRTPVFDELVSKIRDIALQSSFIQPLLDEPQYALPRQQHVFDLIK